MTPRHPPRALGGLTTPTRPPPPTRGPKASRRAGDRDDAMQTSRLCRGPRRRATRRTAHSRLRGTRPFPRQEGPSSPRAFVERLILPLPRRLSNRDACVTNNRIVKDATRADKGLRPGSLPNWSRPAPSWPLARGRGSHRGCPAPHPAEAETHSTTPHIAPPRQVRGGRRRSRTVAVAGGESERGKTLGL